MDFVILSIRRRNFFKRVHGKYKVRGKIHTCGTPSSNNLPVSVNKCVRKSIVQKLVVQIGNKTTDRGQLVGPPTIVPILTFGGTKLALCLRQIKYFLGKYQQHFRMCKKLN